MAKFRKNFSNLERRGSESESKEPDPQLPQVVNILECDRPFKNPNYVTPKRYRPLKQIVSAEKAAILGAGVTSSRSKLSKESEKIVRTTKAPVYYWELEAPPSLIPPKKYCDITGLEAPYLDPKTRLRYHSAEIYQVIKTFPLETPQDYLSIRNAAVILK
ncbi:Co-chaperone [Entomophthora muscae]|uniref:Co-chaperone n=1 Tax=Entomophthora muscae TaxID=34485 RepID=A0ACC2SMN6_9FUNG|nr:Co-chaperone [Entomophthora muscae]